MFSNYKMKKEFILYLENGLGDQMLSLLGGLVVAEFFNRNLVVDWSKIPKKNFVFGDGIYDIPKLFIFRAGKITVPYGVTVI